MKTIAVIATVCVAVTLAALVAKDVDVLVERAEKLVAEANKTIADHIAADRTHLLSTAKYELTSLEKVLTQLKTLQANVSVRTHEVNMLEESLLVAQNRIWEELEFVEDVYKNYNVANKTADEIVQYATVLLTQAKAVIAAHAGHGHTAIYSLESEVRSIEGLIKTIHAHPGTSGSLFAEQTLARHEKSLHNLILRMQH